MVKRCIINTFGQDGFINIEADRAEQDEDFVLFYNGDEMKAMVSKTELKSFYFSEKRK